MNFNEKYHYGIILACCCSNCANVHHGSANYCRLYCKIKARTTRKRLETKPNRTDPDGVCLAHCYDGITQYSIERMGFNGR